MTNREEYQKLTVVADLFSELGLRPTKKTLETFAKLLLERETEFVKRIYQLQEKYAGAFNELPRTMRMSSGDEVYSGQYFVVSMYNAGSGSTRYYPVYMDFNIGKIQFLKRHHLRGDKKIRASYDAYGVYYSSEQACVQRIKKIVSVAIEAIPDAK